MSRLPLVSIIVNNYNYGRFLRAAVDSALGQTLDATEVIVVDDGSTDDSRAIICDYGKRIIPVLKENGGQASAFNAGLAASHGQVVIFLDADDILLSETAARVASAFAANPSVAKFQYRMEIVDEHGRRTGITKPPPHLPLRGGDLCQHVLAFPDDLVWMPTSGNAFSSSVLQRIFPIPERVYGRVGADWYLSHLTPLFGPVVMFKEIGAYYRVHSGNNYELTGATINLDHIRSSIHYASVTHHYLFHWAEKLDLANRPHSVKDTLSVSFIANRLISYKLDARPGLVPNEQPLWLLLLGLTAAYRRFDVSWPMRLLFGLWFVAMILAPRPLARRLALWFLFPETRVGLNRLLGLLHFA